MLSLERAAHIRLVGLDRGSSGGLTAAAADAVEEVGEAHGLQAVSLSGLQLQTQANIARRIECGSWRRGARKSRGGGWMRGGVVTGDVRGWLPCLARFPGSLG
jgi:hypothetical protein